MEKLILDGAAIGFDTSFKHVVDGEIYAFDQGGMLRVRYLYKLPGGGIRIRSENSDEYPDELLTRKDCIRIKMLGRVFWWSTIRRSPPR
ncbi:HTH-type transcriptional regulator PrtR [compost metagenome]